MFYFSQCSIFELEEVAINKTERREICIPMGSTSSARVVSESLPKSNNKVLIAIYRRLFKELHVLDSQTIAKTLFPVPKDLQILLGTGALYVPNKQKYTDQLRFVFNDSSTPPNLKLAFDLLHRIRAHQENLRDRLPELKEQCVHLNDMFGKFFSNPERSSFSAQTVELTPSNNRIPQTTGHPGSIVGSGNRIIENFTNSPITLGTILLAHPLSSAHVDRRVMMITERNPITTSAVVLDLRFTYPLSTGNPMFPEVFWGHNVYDGGFSQIGFTMPPTAQISIIHTLAECPKKSTYKANAKKWFRWGWSRSNAITEAGEAMKNNTHQALCTPLISSKHKNEPTVYYSKVEALPYLADLSLGAPKDSVRIFWGSMRWPTTQLETEIRNGHWIPVTVSSSSFLNSRNAKKLHFPTAEELKEHVLLRKKEGKAFASPQSFPPEKTLRKRDPLWDEILYTLGGEYRDLVGCNNPFSGNTRWAVPQILSPDYSFELSAPYSKSRNIEKVESASKPLPASQSNKKSKPVLPLSKPDKK